MVKDTLKLSKYNKLINKLKNNLNKIEHTESPIKNGDMIKLLELSNAMSKSEAIQFAVKFTLDNYGRNPISLNPIEEKLEKLRYAKEDAHKASGELLDSVS